MYPARPNRFFREAASKTSFLRLPGKRILRNGFRSVPKRGKHLAMQFGHRRYLLRGWWRQRRHGAILPAINGAVGSAKFRVQFPQGVDLAALGVRFLQSVKRAVHVIDELARQFELAGGNIRNVVLAAAFLAAEQGRAPCMEHFIQATASELQKLGKLPSKSDFREYLDLINA